MDDVTQARVSFDNAIRDAEVLLEDFDAVNAHPPLERSEVLKRAGLIVAFTAWETFVEDLLRETLEMRLEGLSDSSLADLVRRRLEADIKQLNNPNSNKTRCLFQDYLDVDVTASWKWPGYEPPEARKRLDKLLKIRGDAVHRSPAKGNGSFKHPVKRDDLEKAIKFLKGLVIATECALQSAMNSKRRPRGVAV